MIVTGFWKETLFPRVKDIIRYGADKLQTTGKATDLVNAAVDTAAATLGAAIPELMPFIATAKSGLKPLLSAQSDKALTAVKDWTIKSEDRH